MKRHIHVLAGALAFVLSISASSPTLFSHDHRLQWPIRSSGLAGANTAEDSQGRVARGHEVSGLVYLGTVAGGRQEGIGCTGGLRWTAGTGRDVFRLARSGDQCRLEDHTAAGNAGDNQRRESAQCHHLDGTDGAGYLTFPGPSYHHLDGTVHTPWRLPSPGSSTNESTSWYDLAFASGTGGILRWTAGRDGHRADVPPYCRSLCDYGRGILHRSAHLHS